MRDARIENMIKIIAGHQTLLKMTNEQVAKKLKVSKSTYSKWKKDPQAMPIYKWWILCKILEVSEDDCRKTM
jgi:transcriptional regulator with XRE-family HTH domain